jgi:tetratricopeptide (TPR) repeat protein
MNVAVSVLLASGFAYQLPSTAQTPAAPVSNQGQMPLVPAPAATSPRSIAAGNPNLTDEARGDIMMARKMYRDAIDFYKPQALKVAVMANKTGIAYHQLGDLDNARKYYERAAKLDKAYPEAWNNLGTVYYVRKSYGNAIKNYRKALAIKPNVASVLTNLGTAYLARKQYQEALQYYQQALAIDPEVFEHRNTSGALLQERSVEEKSMFYYTLAKSYAQAGAADYAIRYTRFALESGFKDRKKFSDEPEFAFLKDNEEFQEILATQQRVL